MRLARGVPWILDFFLRMLPPDPSVLRPALLGALKTVEIALLGTAVAAVLALPLGFVSARNVAPGALFYPARAVLNCFRSVDTLVYALVFVAAVGLGPFPGVLAVVAVNVLLDRPPLSAYAVALQDPSYAQAGLKFATALGGRLLVGTGYTPLVGSCESAEAVAESELDSFLAAVNRCVPSLEATRRDVLRVFSGVLPATAPGSSVPRARNLLTAGGPRGLFTLSGTKFTTARSAALGSR